jgi:hypothetical protein
MKGGDLRYRRKLGSFLDPFRLVHGYCERYGVSVCGTPERKKHFRTINVQWIGQWGLLDAVALPRINKLRVINTLNYDHSPG